MATKKTQTTDGNDAAVPAKPRAEMSEETKAKIAKANKRRARKQWAAVHAAGFTSLAAYKASLTAADAKPSDSEAEGSNA